MRHVRHRGQVKTKLKLQGPFVNFVQIKISTFPPGSLLRRRFIYATELQNYKSPIVSIPRLSLSLSLAVPNSQIFPQPRKLPRKFRNFTLGFPIIILLKERHIYNRCMFIQFCWFWKAQRTMMAGYSELAQSSDNEFRFDGEKIHGFFEGNGQNRLQGWHSRFVRVSEIEIYG